MKIPRNAIANVAEAVLQFPWVKKATRFLDEKTVVKLTRLHKHDGRNKTEFFMLTIGAPNYLERKFIRLCKKAGEPLPVRKTQLKEFPKKRKAKK